MILGEFELRLAHFANVGVKIQLQYGSRDNNAGLFEPHRAFGEHILAFLSVEQMFGADHLPVLAQFDVAARLQLIVLFGFHMLRIDEGGSTIRLPQDAV